MTGGRLRNGIVLFCFSNVLEQHFDANGILNSGEDLKKNMFS